MVGAQVLRHRLGAALELARREQQILPVGVGQVPLDGELPGRKALRRLQTQRGRQGLGLLQTVGVEARQRLDERGLAMVDVPWGAYDHVSRRAVVACARGAGGGEEGRMLRRARHLRHRYSRRALGQKADLFDARQNLSSVRFNRRQPAVKPALTRVTGDSWVSTI